VSRQALPYPACTCQGECGVVAGTDPASGPPVTGTSARARPHPRWGWVAFTTVLLTLAFTGALWFTNNWLLPPPEQPFADGPVVVLGGGGGRDEAGLAIAREGQRRQLVLSSSAAILYEMRGGDCTDAGVRCVAPDPENTFGEAQMIGALADAEGWQQVTVVTSDTHVPRSRMLLERCVDVPVVVVGVPTERGPRYLWRSLREAAGTIVQAVQYRCP
jgi:uncharacterized SAM-binding protein YcdF (DUF218 family)